MKKIAFFDFDGTITRADSMFELIKFKYGSRQLTLGLMSISPYLIAMMFDWVPSQLAKEKLLARFFGGMPEKDFYQLCSDFAEKRLPDLLRPLAVKEIELLRKSNFQIAVVTASLSAWVQPWTTMMGIDLIASEPEITDGRLTGKLNGPNCIGREKVNRIRLKYNLDEYSKIYAYGDSSGDKEMLSIVSHPHFKPFR